MAGKYYRRDGQVLPDNADSAISDFARANRNGATEKTVVVEKYDKDGDEWIRECQIAVEIDADEANKFFSQNGHLGCEIYFANKNKCAGRTMKDFRIGKRIFKMHASLLDGQDPPHYRHEPDSDEITVVRPASKFEQPGRDLKVRYRYKITTVGKVPRESQHFRDTFISTQDLAYKQCRNLFLFDFRIP